MLEQPTGIERLDSWKEIASYLGRDVRTVIRWEQKGGLPVHRIPVGQRQAVFAYRHEIDQWLHNEGIQGEEPLTSIQSDDFPIRSLSNSSAAHDSQVRLSKSASLRGLAIGLGILVLVGLVWVLNQEQDLQIESIDQLSDDSTAKLALVTDGSRLYFSEVVGSKRVLSSMEVHGGPVHHFEGLPENPWPVDISPDGKLMLVFSMDGMAEDHPLWVVPVTGTRPNKVRNVRCESATWSPDSSLIACAEGDAIYLVSPDGGNLRQLRQFNGVPQSINWSKDGTQLTFFLRDPSTSVFALWQLRFDKNYAAGEATALGFARESCCPILRSIRGTDRYFTASNTPTLGQLSYIHPSSWWKKSQFQESELQTKFGEISGLAVDPNDGKLFVLSTSRPHGEMVRYDSSTKTFVPFLPGIPATYVDIAARSGWITYVRTSDNTLWMSQAEGRESKQISPSGMNVELPRWSPDGTKIAFMGRERDKPWRIYIVANDGGNPREALQGEDNQGAPTWSPDGKQIAYANVYCQEQHTCAVHIIDLQSRKATMLPHSQGLSTARWSPDGRHLAALDREHHELDVYDFVKKEWHTLATSTNEDDLSWSVDGHYLYTDRSANGHRAIIRVPLSAGVPRDFLDLGPLENIAGYLSTWFGVAPDGSIITDRWLDTSQIYTISYRQR